MERLRGPWCRPKRRRHGPGLSTGLREDPSKGSTSLGLSDVNAWTNCHSFYEKKMRATPIAMLIISSRRFMAVRPQRLVEIFRLDLVQPVVHWLDRLLACRFPVPHIAREHGVAGVAGLSSDLER